MSEYIPVNINQGQDREEDIYTAENLKKSKRVFFWAEKQFEASSAIMRNMFEASVEENLLTLFAKGSSNYYTDEDNIILEWILNPNETSRIKIEVTLYRKNYIGLYQIIFSNGYGREKISNPFSYFTFAEVDEICHDIMKQINEYMEKAAWK